MTGPEHYTEAERLIRGPYANDTDAADSLAEAQVHATLALAAATASAGGMSGTAAQAWDKATGVER
jgi:hypothetical protein